MNDAPQLQMIAVNRLIPTTDNPRVMREDQAFAELVESIRSVGVLQPLVARPMTTEMELATMNRPPASRPIVGAGQLYDLRAGHRRLAAAKKAGLGTVPVIVREMDDKTAMEVTVTENLQREDLHPLEESWGIQKLLDAGWEAQTIADRLGKTPAWIARRARLRDLSDAWQKAITDPKKHVSVWPATLLERIARLPAETQDAILDADDLHSLDYRRTVPTTAALDRYIATEWLHTLDGVPWEPDDATLVPEAGACTACTKRSSCQPLLFEGLEDAASQGKKKRKKPASDRCLDHACYARKHDAHTRRRHDELKAQHNNLIIVTHGGANYLEEREIEKAWPGVIKHAHVTTCKQSAPEARPAMVVSGSGAGTLKWIKPHAFARARVKQATKTAAGSAGKPAPTPLKQRRQQLTARRQAHVINAVRELLQRDDPWQDDRLTAPQDLPAAAAIVLAFGTEHRHSTRYPTYEYAGGRQTKVDAWNLLRGAQNMPSPDLASRLTASTLDVLADRIQIHTTADAASAYPEVKRICELLRIDLKALETAAAEAIPEPKSWQTLNADGTPKTRKPKAPSAKSKAAASKPAKKKVRKKKPAKKAAAA